MTPEKQAEIERLAAIVQRRRDLVFGLGISNVANKPQEKRIELLQRYEVAKASLAEAESALNAATDGTAK